MTREILFKAKRSDGKGWVEGDLVKNSCGAIRIWEYFACVTHGKFREDQMHLCSGDLHNVIPETVCQYTGLKDKNGEKIFRFDATKCGCVVDWCEHRCGWALKVYDSKEEVYCNCLECEGNFDIFDDKIEIIGNIHDEK